MDESTRDMLERYLDGAMQGPERRMFELRVERDAALRGAVEAQRQIDAALRRRMPAPTMSAASILALAGAASHVAASAASGASHAAITVKSPSAASSAAGSSSAPSIIGSAGWMRRLAIAAVLIAGVFGVWQIWTYLNPPTITPPVSNITTARSYYERKVAQGFEPDWVCDSEQQFRDTFEQMLGQAMTLKAMPDGRRMLGLDYSRVLSPKTIAMLAEADGRQIVVFVDRLTADDPTLIEHNCGHLSVFRREVGALVIYELSPLEEARVMEFLDLPAG